jgi:hypothetical protein
MFGALKLTLAPVRFGKRTLLPEEREYEITYTFAG